jgi:acyl-CoA dehydrogenase
MITTIISTLIGITLLSLAVLFGVRPLRRALVSRPIFRTYKRILPQMSETERVALEAGTVWWDGELFRGNPDWKQAARLSGAEADRRGTVLHGQRGRAGLCAGR